MRPETIDFVVEEVDVRLGRRHQLGAHALGELVALSAAAYRDLAGVRDDDALAELLGYTHAQNARHQLKRGRAFWPTLAAWPWWCWGETGKPPSRDWWRTDEHSVQTFNAWLD
jgi:hypothetical protein